MVASRARKEGTEEGFGFKEDNEKVLSPHIWLRTYLVCLSRPLHVTNARLGRMLGLVWSIIGQTRLQAG